MNNEAMTGEEIAARAAVGEFRYEVESETRAFTCYRVFTGRTERGEVIRCHKSTDPLRTA